MGNHADINDYSDLRDELSVTLVWRGDILGHLDRQPASGSCQPPLSLLLFGVGVTLLAADIGTIDTNLEFHKVIMGSGHFTPLF